MYAKSTIDPVHILIYRLFMPICFIAYYLFLAPGRENGCRHVDFSAYDLVRLVGGWWLVLICCERKILLVGWWLVASAEMM
jgi:hypothetical protein